MKIYLAGGVTVAKVIGREAEVYKKMPIWRRVFSFYFMNLIQRSNILEISRIDKAKHPNIQTK